MPQYALAFKDAPDLWVRLKPPVKLRRDKRVGVKSAEWEEALHRGLPPLACPAHQCESIAIRVYHELGLESRRDWGEYGAELSRIDADPKSSDQRSGGFRNVLLMNFSGFEVPLQTTGANIRSNSSAVVQSSMLEVIS
jgi:hypothetical protein